MLTLERLDELEGRILRALELISDLRSENARLEQDNSQLRQEHDTVKQELEHKDREVASLREQLENTSKEFHELKEREAVLDQKINDMLAKFTALQSSSQSPAPSASYAADDPSDPSSAASVVEAASGSGAAEEIDESFVQIEDDLPGPRVTNASLPVLEEDKEIASGGDELAKEQDLSPVPAAQADESLEESLLEEDGDHLGIFEVDEEDDFLIIDEDKESKSGS